MPESYLKFDTVVGNTLVDQAQLWLFPVYDENGLVLSAEMDGKLKIARIKKPLDSSSYSSIEWITVADSGDTDGDTIADHYHIFAYGYHWISFSVTGADKCYLLKVDSNDLSSRNLYAAYSNDIVEEELQNAVTNDHFLVKDDTGVTLGIFQHATESPDGIARMVMLHFDTDGNWDNSPQYVPVEGPDGFSNGGSAYREIGTCFDGISPCFLIFAPQYIVETVEGYLLLLVADSDWQVQQSIRVLEKTDHSFSFSSMACKGDFRILTVKDADINDSTDGGSIKRYVFDSKFNSYNDETTIVEEKASTPHTILSKRKRSNKQNLITCWHQSNGKPQAYIRVDQVSTKIKRRRSTEKKKEKPQKDLPKKREDKRRPKTRKTKKTHGGIVRKKEKAIEPERKRTKKKTTKTKQRKTTKTKQRKTTKTKNRQTRKR